MAIFDKAGGRNFNNSNDGNSRSDKDLLWHKALDTFLNAS